MQSTCLEVCYKLKHSLLNIAAWNETVNICDASHKAGGHTRDEIISEERYGH
jgi:hypothetical protein